MNENISLREWGSHNKLKFFRNHKYSPIPSVLLANLSQLSEEIIILWDSYMPPTQVSSHVGAVHGAGKCSGRLVFAWALIPLQTKSWTWMHGKLLLIILFWGKKLCTSKLCASSGKVQAFSSWLRKTLICICTLLAGKVSGITFFPLKFWRHNSSLNSPFLCHVSLHSGSRAGDISEAIKPEWA